MRRTTGRGLLQPLIKASPINRQRERSLHFGAGAHAAAAEMCLAASKRILGLIGRGAEAITATAVAAFSQPLRFDAPEEIRTPSQPWPSNTGGRQPPAASEDDGLTTAL
jgi:hypothetical protein